LAATPAVAVSRLGKYFPQIELCRLFSGGSFSGSWALQDVSLELWPGENLSILGPNGSGKTTLLKLIATLLIPTQGRIFVQGHDTVRRPLAVKRHLNLFEAQMAEFVNMVRWQKEPSRCTFRDSLRLLETLELLNKS
jgi:ABC-type multidrug transport system ATPase subunit